MLQTKAALEVKDAELARNKAEAERNKAEAEKNKAEAEKNAIELELKQKDIEIKNRDLENFSIRLMEKNEFIETLEKGIFDLKGSEQDKNQLLELIKTIRNNVTMQKENLEIENKINETYKGFNHKLERNFPFLSKTEKKLCSLIILDLNNKDISKITAQEIESVKKSKQRMKKKLSLGPEDSLGEFLKKL
jgi:hypothetical protein